MSDPKPDGPAHHAAPRHDVDSHGGHSHAGHTHGGHSHGGHSHAGHSHAGHSHAGHSHGGHSHGGHFDDAAACALLLEDSERDAWQVPDRIIAAMDLEPGMTIADIGAGTGYFAVRLARAAPDVTVITTDQSPGMVHYLQARARTEQLPNLRVNHAGELAPESLDRILLVHVWHHLDDRPRHARALAAALRPGGRLYLVEFAPDASRGPPPELRLHPDAVLAELTEAGLFARLSEVPLPDQLLVVATRQPGTLLPTASPSPTPAPYR